MHRMDHSATTRLARRAASVPAPHLMLATPEKIRGLWPRWRLVNSHGMLGHFHQHNCSTRKIRPDQIALTGPTPPLLQMIGARHLFHSSDRGQGLYFQTPLHRVLPASISISANQNPIAHNGIQT
tara:strand:- start:2062 stop:2436 length:375 start_codon:yes stop_codon:yes gene_type:complete